MDPKKAKSIFLQAVEHCAPSQWPVYLDDACGEDAHLRHGVELLLAAHAEQVDLAEVGRAAWHDALPTVDRPALERPGTQIGPYKLVEVIGQGGMGVVYAAQQTEPVARQVALKVIRPGMDTQAVIARFEAERQALAVMDHPNVAKVLDAGTTNSGRPYFVMELVQGVAITKYCDQHELSIRQRLELFISVCQAVQHAHQKGIIHRDIKPSNILVAEFDGRPVPKVIDFGVAKAIDQRGAQKQLTTQYGQIVGTLEYMSPEQARLSQHDVDTRSDVYSLGAVLYELLTGITPFDKDKLYSAAFAQALQMIETDELPKPSLRLSSGDSLPSAAALRHVEPQRLIGLIRGELDWIVMKALEKEPARRYESAAEFARDIENHLQDRPVLAGPPSAGYRLRKFARRNKSILAMTAVVAVALVVGTSVATWQAVRAHAQAVRAEEEKARALATLRTAVRAVDEMYSEVAENQLASTPMAEPIRLQLLEKAVRFYTSVSTIHTSDRELRFERAKAFARLGSCLRWLGKDAEAEPAQRTAVREFEQLIAETPDVPAYQMELASCCIELGFGLDARTHHAESDALFARARTVLQPLEETAGDSADRQFQLGRAFEGPAWYHLLLKCYDEAEVDCRKALAIWERQVTEFPDDMARRSHLAESYHGLAIVLQATGRKEEAAAHLEKSARLQEQVVACPPVNPDHRFYLSATYIDYGRALEHLGRAKEAEEQYRKSLLVSAELAEDFPHVPRYRDYWRHSYSNLSGSLQRRRRPSDAESILREVVDLADHLVKQWPTIPSFQQQLATAQIDLGFVLLLGGRLPEAEQELQQAIALAEQLSTDIPDDPENRMIWARALDSAAIVFFEQGRHTEAQSLYAEELEVRRRLLANGLAIWTPDDPDLAQCMNDLAWLLSTCPDTQLRVPQEAVALAKKLMELAPNNAVYENTLGVAHYRAGDYAAAVETLNKCVAMTTGTVHDFLFLAMAHAQMGNSQEGKKWFDQAVGLLNESDSRYTELQRFRAEAASLLGIDNQMVQQRDAKPVPAPEEAANVEHELGESTAEKQKGEDAKDGDGPAS